MESTTEHSVVYVSVINTISQQRMERLFSADIVTSPN